MAPAVLLTHHHRQAMRHAAARGFWMPLALEPAQLPQLHYLTALSPGQACISALLEITAFEPWRVPGIGELWLPFVGQRLCLPRPLPLGPQARLRGWLPKHRDDWAVVPWLALLAAQQLSDLAPQR
ncbi:MAG: hypothetical protein RLZZ168_742 [Cyanobacteriota bacterium]|jgi:hypothetical protein